MEAARGSRRLSADFWGNLGTMGLAVYFYALATEYPTTARKFPQLVLLVVIGLSGLGAARETLRRRSAERVRTAHPEGNSPSGYVRAGWVVALMFGFLACMLGFGFTLGTLLFLLVAIWTLGYRKPARVVLSSLLITGFMYAIFILVMSSLLPHGLLWDLG